MLTSKHVGLKSRTVYYAATHQQQSKLHAMFTQPKQDINIWDLELCILHPGTQRVWGAKFELDITELNSKLRHMQKGSSYRLRLLTCGGRLFPQLSPSDRLIPVIY